MTNLMPRWLKRFLVVTLLTALVVYLAVCAVVYRMQQSLLFPTQVAQPVASNWQPKASAEFKQATFAGQCGQLHAVLWYAPQAKGTLMMFHGNGESLASIDDYASRFLALGYNLMAWDYPGYGRSTACQMSQASLLSDAETAYQWLSMHEQASRVHLFGYSIGTGLALAVAAKHAQNPVFLVAAYDSLLQVAQDTVFKYLPLRWLISYPMQTNAWVQQIKVPIFLLHGTADTLIKPERIQAFTQANITWVNNAGHADDRLFAARDLWLKHYLP